jgi:hypothetical protein
MDLTLREIFVIFVLHSSLLKFVFKVPDGCASGFFVFVYLFAI